MSLMREELPAGSVRSDVLAGMPDGSGLEIAGLVTARQRPGTARGVVFMLLEDEAGMTNVVVLPDVYDRDRLAVRTASFVTIRGRLERREGVVNVIADRVIPLERPDLPVADVRTIEPDPARETGGHLADIAAELPAVQSFGRRG